MATDTHAARSGLGRLRGEACLRLLVIQPTPFCNVNCSYCYLPNRTSTVRMSTDVLESTFTAVFGASFLGPQLDVAWHAGEPLVLPVAWYADAIACMARHAPPTLVVTHCFQTNGLLLNRKWAAFLAQIGARVGLSIDGPADLHDRHRRTRAGSGTHDGAMRALGMLREHGVPFHVITVLTDAALDEPERLFDFYVRNGITEVGFNVEEIEGVNGISSLSGPTAEARFRAFLARFLSLVWSSPGVLRLREAEATLEAIQADGPVVDEQNQPFEILTIGVDGSMSTFSPELLGTRHARFASFAFGHVAQGCAAMAGAPAFRRVAHETQTGIEACARTCAYFRWCGGGAPANKLFETGRFDATETMHCRLTRQIVLDEVLTQVEIHTRGLPVC
jgi:uncharacterized protein